MRSMRKPLSSTGKDLRRAIPALEIRDRLIDRLSFASDAGFYQLIPEAVVFPSCEEDIQQLMAWCRQTKRPLVFRAGGSSLSGQSITDGILCVISKNWKQCIPEQEGKLVRVQPGITGALVNARLKPFGRKIGPDPSSISAAMMGGILSNNASGMCCGVQHNSYHTTRFIRFILAGGETFSTENTADYQRFLQNAAPLASCISELRNEIRKDEFLREKIRERYRQKNTVGYSLNSFLDYEHPLDIFAHLMIGAEGTLGFISEAVLETVPDYRHKSCGLLFFEDITSACEAAALLNEAGALMVELMDRASLRAIENKAGMPDLIRHLDAEACALLAEFQAETEEELGVFLERFSALSQRINLLHPPSFSSDEQQRTRLWQLRKGLFPAVGAVRKSGTSVILEDLVFPLQVLGKAVQELRILFERFAYYDAIIFGHARDGNIHFVLSQSFNETSEIERYARFMDEVVSLVMQMGGSLKAEHGTGRNMAPFVKTEWGPEAYAIMQKLKAAADPAGILNPGVILNGDEQAHIRNLKPLPEVEEEVDKCIECGYCEHVCPSRELSSSPRRRIAIRRAIALLNEEGKMKEVYELQKDQQREVLDSCAVDGLCALACPVDINTGDLVKRLRKEGNSPLALRTAAEAAANFSMTEHAAGLLLGAGRKSGSFGKTISKALHNVHASFPVWPASVPPAFRRKTQPEAVQAEKAEFLYFPSCINRKLGGIAGNRAGSSNVMDAFLNISQKAGKHVKEILPAEGLCCGQVFSSKGFTEAASIQAERWLHQVWKESLEGRLPVICDVSSCTWTLRNMRPLLRPGLRKKYDLLKLMDMMEFLHDHILPVLPAVEKAGKIWIHPVCALQKMGSTEKLLRIGRHFAHEVAEPLEGGCCGMAGDRGFFMPELPSSAISASGAKPAAEEKMFSCTATCEMALANHFEMEVNSVLKLMEDAFLSSG